jgi:hypothetical protein
VAGVLPDRHGDDQRGITIDATKDLDAPSLSVDEAVTD